MPGVRREGRGHVGYSTSSATDAWLCSLRLQATAHLNVGLLLGQGSAKQLLVPSAHVGGEVRCAEISITEEQAQPHQLARDDRHHATAHHVPASAPRRGRHRRRQSEAGGQGESRQKSRQGERGERGERGRRGGRRSGRRGGRRGGRHGRRGAAEGGDPRDAALARGHPRCSARRRPIEAAL